MDRKDYDFFPQENISQNSPTLVGIYPTSKGTLQTGAFVDSLTGFVKLPPGASVTIDVDVDTKGFPFGAYEFVINYVSSNYSVFKIDVNNKNTGKVYSTESTKSLNAQDSKNLKIVLQLNSGKNKIKFYSYAKMFSPNLGNITINALPQGNILQSNQDSIGIYPTSKGTLQTGAFVDSLTGFVKLPPGASVTIDVDVDTKGFPSATYEFIINYVSSNYSVFKIDVNNKSTGMVYSTESTKSLNAQDSKNLKIVLKLNSGKNTIRFYSYAKMYSPDLGNITINALPQEKTSQSYPILVGVYSTSKGTLKTGAFLDSSTGFVKLPPGASVTIDVNVDTKGFPFGAYEFVINYVSSNYSVFKIDVNNKSTGMVYSTESTKSLNAQDSKNLKIVLQLNSGKNTIKFYSHARMFSPDLGNITVNILPNTFPAIQPTPMPPEVGPPPIMVPPNPTPSPIPNNSGTSSTPIPIDPFYFVGIYSPKELILDNGASILNSTDFIGWLGGSKDGSATLDIKVDKAGCYEFLIKYLSSENRCFKVDVNDKGSIIIYKPLKTNGWSLNDTKIYSFRLQLNAGLNKVKIHGDGNHFSPDIGDIAVKFYKDSIKHTPNLGEFTVEPFHNKVSSSVTLVGSAIINGDFIEGIDSNEGGEVVLNVTVPNKGIYDFGIYYVIPDDKKLKIDVNEVNTGLYYNFLKTDSLYISDEKIKVIQLSLIKGENTIRIYN